MASTAFVQALARRHSIYAIGRDLPCSPKDVVKLVTDAARHVPSSFNSQSCRLVILFNEDHKNFWESVKSAIRQVSNDEQYAASEAKVNNCFLAGAGTVLFYLDRQVVENLQKQMPLYAKNFPSFALQTSAMTQYAVWTTLSEAKIGATLQHYNELIEGKTREMFQVPEKWQLVAQMPFGSIKEPGHEKTTIPDKSRIMVLGLDSRL